MTASQTGALLLEPLGGQADAPAPAATAPAAATVPAAAAAAAATVGSSALQQQREQQLAEESAGDGVPTAVWRPWTAGGNGEARTPWVTARLRVQPAGGAMMSASGKAVRPFHRLSA